MLSALVAFVMKDALLAAVNGEIDLLKDDKEALGDSARADKLAEIVADKLAVERSEEALICAAEAAGMAIARRETPTPARF